MHMNRLFHISLLVLTAWLLPAEAMAQAQPTPLDQPVTMTLDEAIQIALVNNYAIQTNRLDVADASAQIRQVRGQALPQVDLSSSYTRNVKSANPFAGSEAGGLFGALGFVGWLAYNEEARTDTDPGTEPISFGEFSDRQAEGIRNAGASTGGSDNPFNVPNQFQNGVTVSQELYNRALFSSIKGARQLKEINEHGVDRQEQLLVQQVKQAFYQALLADEQARVVALSMERTQQTLDEIGRRVSQGTMPKFQRLSTEVELANQETQLVQTQNQAAIALDNLKLLLAMPVQQPLRLRGTLDRPDLGQYQQVSLDDALALAHQRRPDLDQASVLVDLRRIDRDISKADYHPRLSAFANFNYTGSVPDDRQLLRSDPNDPFTFTTSTNSFFSSDYWNPAVNVGMRLTWNLFNGFQTSARVQQRTIAMQRAELEYLQLRDAVALEVEQAMRNLQTAAERIRSQDRNVERAELNYEYANTRVREGVSSQLELRDASDQLDQSRLGYIQAVHDYLVARSAFETALGMPLATPDSFNLTSN